MKKTTWLLLALSLVAMLLVAGCAPTTPTPTASPTAAPTATPTTPPADKACPKVVSTTVGSAYRPVWWVSAYRPVWWVDDDYEELVLDYVTKLTITFDEAITSGCIEDPTNWDITVKNNDRNDTTLTEDEGITIMGTTIPKVNVLDVSLSTDGKKAYVYAVVLEDLSYVVKDVVYKVGTVTDTVPGPFPITDYFDGLICSEDDADDYAKPSDDAIISAAGLPTGAKILDYDLVSGPDTPEYADVVEWKLKDCVVADELGNACCDYSGSACCLERESVYGCSHESLGV